MKISFDLLTGDAQKEFWAALALRHCENLTPRLLRTLLVHYGSAYATFCNLTQQKVLSTQYPPKKFLPKTIISSLRQEKWRIAAHHEWRLSKHFLGEIILWTDYRYPLGLKQIIDAPAFFYVKGDTSLLASPSVAIVGSRKYHPNTLEKTHAIAQDLSACGICVISGMAKGIDFAAHSGALSQIGKTIAVLGCGADVVYPPEHTRLYNEIVETGLIISEFAPQSKPLAGNFPIRNRIVSGLSEAVLVAEAAPRSGSLITARLALEQNRNVYVLKPMHENHSLGCHALIEDGAVQVEDALSIIADIAPNLQEKFNIHEVQNTSTPNLIMPEKVNVSAHANTTQTGDNAETAQTPNLTQSKQAIIPKNTCTNTETTHDDKYIEIESAINNKTTKNAIESNSNALSTNADANSNADADANQNAFSTNPNANINSDASTNPDTDINEDTDATINAEKQEKIKKPATKKTTTNNTDTIYSDKIYPAQTVQSRPNLNETLPILDIDFANLANELMGKTPAYQASDVLTQRPKKKSTKGLDKAALTKNTTHKNDIVVQHEQAVNNSLAKKSESSAHGALGQNIPINPKKDRTNLGELERRILSILDKKQGLVPDEIFVQLPQEMQDISALSMTLLMLEVEEYIVRLSGNRYQGL